MLLTIEGKGNNIIPFQKLVKRYEKTGRAIDPNANRIMKDLMGHAYDLGLRELSEVFHEAFDPDVRNAIAHADYILAPDAMRLRKRNGGQPRIIGWQELDGVLGRGLNLFGFIRQFADEYTRGYSPAKTIKSRLNANEPLMDYTLYYDPRTGAFGFTTGTKLPPGVNADPIIAAQT